MRQASDRAYDLGMLLLRLGFGLGFLYFHGWAMLMGGPERWAGTGAAIGRLGVPFWHTFFGFMAALAQSLGGLLIAVGLFFRTAAVFLGFTMFTAWTMHVRTGQGTPANAFKNLWVAIGISFMGPGRYSLDWWLANRNRPRGPTIELERTEE